MNTRIIMAALALSASTAACGGGPCGLTINKLQGSVSESFDIEVDRVRVRKVDINAVAVEYYHGNDIVAKVIADTTSYAKGAEIPLSNGDIKRITSPDTMYPSSIERGGITFDSELRAGSDCIGCFTSLFNMPDGSQRTLEGAFQANLEDLNL